MNKKYYKYIFFIIIILVIFAVLLINNKGDSRVLRCYESESPVSVGESNIKTNFEVYFYFDEKNQKVIKERIVYQETFDKEEIGNYAEDPEYYYNEAYCENLFGDHSSCKVIVEENKATVEAIYESNNLSKNLLTYNNMPKEQVKKYIENGKAFKCD